MNKKTYYYAATIIFSIIAVLHLVRAINGWEAEIGGLLIPVWVSWVAALLAGYLAYRGSSFLKK